MRLLLVEDDPRMRALVRRGLAEHGHVVEVASTGPEAVELAAAADFDVAVLDVMLPGFDGVEVVQRLRARANRTPVLMLTARDAA
ncbi:MAG TPA: response regulator, partial [Vicinamibacterales bacterium]|nr:response regulator [Vicinamibacterales bacterium]